MKYSFLGFGIIMAGMLGVVFLTMFQSITLNNEAEYYVLKEAMEAAMLESVDLTCFRNNEADGCGGAVKISEQKFVENFTRRFSASIEGNVNEYDIQFYDIIESPPKATVVITGLTDEYKVITDDTIGITNSLSGILEHKLDVILNGNEGISDYTLELDELENGDFSTVVDDKSKQNKDFDTFTFG